MTLKQVLDGCSSTQYVGDGRFVLAESARGPVWRGRRHELKNCQAFPESCRYSRTESQPLVPNAPVILLNRPEPIVSQVMTRYSVVCVIRS